MTRKAYKTDITDAQWQILEPLIPPAKTGGHPRTVNMREVVNGIFYVLRTGCGWEMLPHDLPPYSTVYHYFRRLLLRTTLRERQKTGVWQEMNTALRQRLRQEQGRNPQPSAAICASQQCFAIASVCGATVEVVKRSEAGFQVLPRRWVVERTLGWLGRYRRLSKDYELLPEVSESMIYAAMVRLMLHRLAS